MAGFLGECFSEDRLYAEAKYTKMGFNSLLMFRRFDKLTIKTLKFFFFVLSGVLQDRSDFINNHQGSVLTVILCSVEVRLALYRLLSGTIEERETNGCLH